DAARSVEAELGLKQIELPAELLRDVETFPALEDKLLRHAEQDILQGNVQPALELAGTRKHSFWAREDPALQLRWSLLETAARLLQTAARVKAELKPPRKDAAALVRAYTGSASDSASGRVAPPGAAEPWYLLDTYHRRLEWQYATFDLALG